VRPLGSEVVSTCSTCRWWSEPTSLYGIETVRYCLKIEQYMDRDRPQAWLLTAWTSAAYLATPPEFGCTMWEEKS